MAEPTPRGLLRVVQSLGFPAGLLGEPTGVGDSGGRDTQVIAAIIAALKATGRFGAIYSGTAPERTTVPAGTRVWATVATVPGGFEEADDDNPRDALRTVKFAVAVVAESATPDRAAAILERLDSVVQNAIYRDRSLGGLVIPRFTLVSSGRQVDDSAAQRGLAYTGQFAYVRSKIGFDESGAIP
jgi:hypothetical protein